MSAITTNLESLETMKTYEIISCKKENSEFKIDVKDKEENIYTNLFVSDDHLKEMFNREGIENCLNICFLVVKHLNLFSLYFLNNLDDSLGEEEIEDIQWLTNAMKKKIESEELIQNTENVLDEDIEI